MDAEQNRCTLSLLPTAATSENSKANQTSLSQGTRVSVQVITVKATQLNVQINGNTHGRIDITSIFDSWDTIKSKKSPLKLFQAKQSLDAVVIGMHDARTHSFLPITHRKTNAQTIYELSMKPTVLKNGDANVATLESLKVGMQVVGFVNNHAADGLWISLSPSCRGFVRTLEISENTALLKDVQKNFPIGSALQCRVLKIDKESKRLDLTGKSSDFSLDWDSIRKGMVLSGRITKVSADRLLVNLTPEISGTVSLVDIADDFDAASTSSFSINQIVTVCVVGMDVMRKRVLLSTRPSRIGKDDIAIVDGEVLEVSQIAPNTARRGFVRSITDKGLFVTLGEDVTALVRVSNISDSYIKEWKPLFKVGQLVKGRIVACDHAVGRIEMSLKSSVLSNDQALLQFSDLHVGQVVRGKVSGVADYGVFINIEGSVNLSGLCHKSELSDEADGNTNDLSVGDAVMAKILSLDAPKKKVAFGLKPSYFISEDADELSTSESEDEGGDQDEDEEDEEERPVKEFTNNSHELLSEGKPLVIMSQPISDGKEASVQFDWSLTAFNDKDASGGESDAEVRTTVKRKKRASLKEDLTQQLAIRGPESTSEFERAVLEAPQSSIRWIEYMSFLLRLNEVEKAREVAERALKRMRSDSIEAQKEKMNIWVALLNLENEFGTEESLDSAFTRSCQYNDDADMFRKFTELLVSSGKFEKAEVTLKAYTKKHPTAAEPYLLHAELLFSPPQPHQPQLKRAREILPHALTVIPKTSETVHINLISKFALMEFKYGDPERSRTIFENLLNRYPKRTDVFSIWMDLEIGLSKTNKTHCAFVRNTFARTLNASTCEFAMRGIRSLLKKWERWELEVGGNESAAHSAALEFAKSPKV